jgi:hypothetical protein
MMINMDIVFKTKFNEVVELSGLNKVFFINYFIYTPNH